MASTSEGRSALLEQFCAVTGSSEEVGQRLLEACNNNLEMAIGMHMDGVTGENNQQAAAPGTSSGASASASTVAPPIPAMPDEEEVRAPIPQKTEVLVQENYPAFVPEPLKHLDIGFRARRRQARSVFDGFRDFQAEARQQEQGLAAPVAERGHEGREKRQTLEDLFRPPIELMHKGTFHTARDAGSTSHRWLMVNIQNVSEFVCQTLNRDVWSNAGVRTIIQEHFIFWQVYHDSEEGRKYMQFYNVKEWPHIAILDPRTGETMVSWNKIDPLTFCELVTDFLTAHPKLDGSFLSPPPKKFKRSVSSSLVDASEDSQMEAAIQASLQQLEEEQGTTTANSTSESELGDDDLETFSDSDSETHPSPKKSLKKCENNHTVPDGARKKLTIDEDDDDDGDDENDDENDNDEEEKNEENGKEMDENINEEEKREDEKASTSSEMENTNQINKDKWKEFLGDENDPSTNIMLRFPDGKREQLRLPCSSKLMALVQFAMSQGYFNERYELVTTFPRRKLSQLDYEMTIKDAGLHPQETVFIQER